MNKMEYAFDDFYNEFKDWTKKQILHRTFDIILKDTEEIEEKDKEIERLTAESTEWESKCYKYQDIIDELEKYINEELSQSCGERELRDLVDGYDLLDKLKKMKNK